MSKLIDVEVRLPTATIEALQDIAKMTGLKAEQVARVFVAMYVRQHTPKDTK